MKKYVYNALKFAGLVVALFSLLVSFTSWFVSKKSFNHNQTESNILLTDSVQNYDILFIGISHARMFSKYTNHQNVQEILQSKIVNLGQGFGICGPNELLFHLQYFYKNKNHTNSVIYVLSPPMLFSENLTVNPKTFNMEPVRLDFLSNYLSFESEYKSRRIFDYLRSKLYPSWINHRPIDMLEDTLVLEKIDSAEIKKGFDIAYNNGLDENRYNKSCLAIEKTIKLALENNSKFVFIITPAIFGKWPGHDQTLEFAKEMEVKYNVPCYDFSESVKELSYYKDHHHLNSDGVEYFTLNFLKSILNNY